MNNLIDPADKKIFNKISSIHSDMKETLVRLLMTEVELEAARGNPNRFRGYRKAVLTWMRDNINDSGKRQMDTNGNQDFYKVEYEFDRKNKKRQRVVYPDEPVKIPTEILQAAFLSGQNNRLYQTHTQEGILPFEKVIQDSNRVSGTILK